MNRKGFTLIELLAVIVLLAIIVGVVAPNVLDSLQTGKDKTYEIMVSNVVTAAKEYYEECNYGTATVKTKINCHNNEVGSGLNGYKITLGDLVKYGYLTGTTENNDDGNAISVKKTINNPKSQKDISECKIQILRSIEEGTTKVTYIVSALDNSGVTNSSECIKQSDFEKNAVGTVH